MSLQRNIAAEYDFFNGLLVLEPASPLWVKKLVQLLGGSIGAVLPQSSVGGQALTGLRGVGA